ncbi:MAG: thiamine-phosphate kinase, partial [Pedobacter sp.]
MFENKERTAISDLGEFGLIKHLTTNFKIQHETSLK